jgi:hypothetical protein
MRKRKEGNRDFVICPARSEIAEHAIVKITTTITSTIMQLTGLLIPLRLGKLIQLLKLIKQVKIVRVVAILVLGVIVVIDYNGSRTIDG